MRLRSWFRNESRLALGAFALMVSGMVATPLFARGGDERRILALVVVGGLFVTALASMERLYGALAILVAIAIISVGLIIEIVGSSTGFPFGEYDYSGALTPQVFGVPIAVAFAWAGITLTVHGALNALPLDRTWKGLATRVVLMALAITAWDLFLDPQMVAEGYWSWAPASPSFREIPVVNYLGWLFTSTITSTIAVLICKPVHGTPMSLLRLTYATLTVLSTIGFLLFFDDAVVALTGGLVMGIFVFLSYSTARTKVS